MRRIAATIALASLVALAGCGEEQAAGPTTGDLKSQRDALAQKLASKAKKATKQAEQVVAQGDPTENSFAGAGMDYVYDPTGKRDPFRSFRWERESDVMQTTSVGPLEQFELEQLAVTAVVWSSGRPRALVADPSGRSYIVREGTKIGKNSGLVIHIGDNLVLVKETYVDFAGDQTTKDVELRIRRSQGG